MRMIYRNYRGEYSVREVGGPASLEFSDGTYHPAGSMILRIRDIDKGEMRDFCLSDSCLLRPTRGLMSVLEHGDRGVHQEPQGLSHRDAYVRRREVSTAVAILRRLEEIDGGV